MRIRLFNPLRIVILLFAGAFVLFLIVAVYQAKHGPLMQQELARANVVREVLQRAAKEDVNRRAVEDAMTDDAETPSPLAAPNESNALSGAIRLLREQTVRRFPYAYLLIHSPFSFPECMEEDLNREIAMWREIQEDRTKWLHDYDAGKLDFRVLSEMSESERGELRNKRQRELEKLQRSLASCESLLTRIRTEPEGIWMELLEYLEQSKTLRDVEEGLHLTPETLPSEASETIALFTCRAILETHAGRYAAALLSLDTACALAARSSPRQRSAGASEEIVNVALPYIIDRAPLNAAQRTFLLSALSKSSSATAALDDLCERLRQLAAKAEAPLDQAEMAQLKLDSADATVYRSPFEIADRTATALHNSLDDGLHVLLDARDSLRAISGAPYASTSPSFFGPKGRMARYVGYMSRAGAEANAGVSQAPALLSTAKFVDEAIGIVERRMQRVSYVDVVRTAWAIKDYKTANGRYPDKLKDVTPEFLAQIPIVAGTGKPLAYATPFPNTDSGYILASDPVSPTGYRLIVWRAEQ